MRAQSFFGKSLLGLAKSRKQRRHLHPKHKEGRSMATFTFTHKHKGYEVDSKGFLLDFDSWDENFAEGMAPEVKIAGGLTKEHWDVIYTIRSEFKEMGRCPLVYITCKISSLRVADLEKLFPTGYLRGACKLAGITCKVGHLGLPYHPAHSPDTISFMESYNKTYEVDVRGFLMNPDQWDEYYAIHRAYETKIPGGKLTDKHWQIINFLREKYKEKKKVPTVYETCTANGIDVEELEELFPDGYHRSAVKIAGLWGS